MVTAVEPDFDAFELGFDDSVVEPVLHGELAELIDRLAEQRRALTEDDCVALFRRTIT